MSLVDSSLNELTINLVEIFFCFFIRVSYDIHDG